MSFDVLYESMSYTAHIAMNGIRNTKSFCNSARTADPNQWEAFHKFYDDDDDDDAFLATRRASSNSTIFQQVLRYVNPGTRKSAAGIYFKKIILQRVRQIVQ